MSADCLPLADLLLAQSGLTRLIAYHEGEYVDFSRFRAAVMFWAKHFAHQPEQEYAVYSEDAYPFTVWLFALLHTGKRVWIPGNNRPGTAQQLLANKCQLIGTWDEGTPFDTCSTAADDVDLKPINPHLSQIVIFTSGSTGTAKAIKKTLQQFQSEIATLEKFWGKTLATAEILATVSHQHIYGLLFRVLWPLSVGRCWHSSIYLNPEMLVNHADKKSCWIASPAHLKRLASDSPWQKISQLSAIFSSGGTLPDFARQQIQHDGKQQVIEIYGSSETGGIGWRQEAGAWNLFPDMRLIKNNDKCLLTSPYLPDQHSYPLDDSLTLLNSNQFVLHGRSDRIVKVEEKRLSLTELEQRICTLPWVQETAALLIPKQREVVAVVIALRQDDFQNLPNDRPQLINQLRETLLPWFEPVTLPRKWLFAQELPLTTQGKIDTHWLTQLLHYDEKKLPQPLSISIATSAISIGLKVSANLMYFPDHFPNYPILPGVVQLAWAEYFGKLFFGSPRIRGCFAQMDVIKFLQVIRPDDELTLNLDWNNAAGELMFNFSAKTGICSTGKLLYKVNTSPKKAIQ